MNIFDLAAEEAARQGVDPSLVMRLVRQESGGRANAVSPKGARGPMQLMPATAKGLGVNIDDPADNIRGGVAYLKQQLDTFRDPSLALAAYNAGPGAVRKYGGVPPYAETQGYVRSIMGGQKAQSGADIFGMGEPQGQAAKGGSGADIFADPPSTPRPKPAQAPIPQVSVAQMKAFARGGKPEVTTPMDMAKGVASGLYQSVISSAPQAAGDQVRRMVEQGADVAAGINSLLHGKIPQLHPLATTSPGSPSAQAITSAAGQDYQPQTRAGRAAQTLGSMLPAAVLPGSIPQRVANVLLPTAGSELGGAINERLGGGQTGDTVARSLGGMAGGILANTRIVPQERAMPPEDVAAMRYVDKVAGGTPIEQLAAAPGNLTGAEAIGQRGKAAIGALARREGATGDALNAEVSARQLGRPGRLLDAFANVTGVAPEAAAGDLQTLVEAGRAKAAPLYEQAYASGPIDTPVLRTLTARPSVKAALGKAVKIAAEEGRKPDEIGLAVAPEGGEVAITTPTAQTWDYVKRGLDDVLEGYRDKTTGKLVLDNEGRAVVQTLKDLRGELTQANPTYGKALEVSGDYLSAEDAFRTAGKDIFNSNLTERQFAEKFGKLSESSQQAYKGGIANRIYDLAQNGRLDPKVLRTGRVQTKLRMALGDEGAQRLIDLASQEGDMLAFERRYGSQGNSITQEMAAAQAEQDAMGGKGAQMAGDFVGNLHRGPVKAVGSAVGRQVQSLLDAVGPTRGMSVAARDKAGEALLLSPDELARAIQRYRAMPPRGLPQARVAPDPRLTAFITGSPSR